jgi:predicted nucleotidyltransferase
VIRFAADENFNHDILRALQRHIPGIDIATVQETGRSGAADDAVLEWSANDRRALPRETSAVDRARASLTPTVIRVASTPRRFERGSYTTGVSSVSNRRPAVAEFVKRLREMLPDNILDVRLYGSEARGDATPESDIDVLVVVQPDSERNRLQERIVDIAFDVNVQFDVFISPCVLSPEILNHPVWGETPFIETIMREGVPL